MRPIVLAILDGVGIREELKGNAFKQAHKPNFDYLIGEYPNSELEASGRSVGLPTGQMGNSEVGHLNIGAGRIVYQPLEIINDALRTENLYNNDQILSVVNHVKNNNSRLHVMGLLSDGGVHSHIEHIMGMLELVKRNNVSNIYFHIFTDGRDTLPDKAFDYIKELEEEIASYGIGKIATVSGRFYAMDRDKRWDRTKLAYDAMINGLGPSYNSAEEAVRENYVTGVYDEFVIPSVIEKEGIIKDNDGIIYVNFRTDRATQTLTAITNNSFENFETKALQNIKLVTLMPCAHSVIGVSAYEIGSLENTLGTYLSNLSYTQLRIAETEKYAHVTFFFDGGTEKILDGCTRILINSPKVRTYDLAPEMSAIEVTDRLLSEIDTGKHDIIILNYANPDMVGHTGNIDATISAIETVDKCLGRVYKKVKEKRGLLIVTADHGNCEYMVDESDNIVTAHSNSKVPIIVCDKSYQLKNGKLGDIAPTMLKIMKIDIPKEMTGDVLI